MPTRVPNPCEQLLARVADIRAAWQSASADALRTARIDDRVAATPEDVVRCAISAGTCYAAPIGRTQACVSIAADYGARMRALGVAHDELLGVLGDLRCAIDEHVAALLGDGDVAARIMTRVDAMLRLMARVAVTGYHRREHEARGSWSQALDRIVAEHDGAAPHA